MRHLWTPSGLGAFIVPALSIAAACSGKTIVDGAGGTTAGSTSSGTATASSAQQCSSHEQCPGGVCVFSTGLCSPSCTLSDPCPAGEICDSCATSSCPECYDCLAACVPAEPGWCDDHDDCPQEPLEQLCLYEQQQCAPACTGDSCADDQICDSCATSSCPGCKDCVSACVPA